jgi:hypothetical protein
LYETRATAHKKLAATDLKPAAVAGLLRDAIAEDRDLFTLPDLRSAPAAQSSRGR